MSDPSATIDRLVCRAGQFYSLPAVAMKVLELTGDPQLDTHALRACIENDPALTTKILRVVNSSLFGLSREVSDLNQALTLLGTKPLKLLVLGFSLPEGLFAGVAADALARYWRHTVTKAVAAREIAETLWRQPGDDAFIAGLLQDLGMLLLIQEVGRPYLSFLAQVDGCGGDLIALETETMGFDHTAISARLLAQWGLPRLLVENVAWHDVRRAVKDPSPPAAALPRILQLAELTARLLGGGQPELLGQVLEVGDRYCELSQSQLEALVAELEEKVSQLADVLRLELPRGLDYREVLVEAHRQLAQVAAEAAGDLLGQGAARREPPADSGGLAHQMELLSEAIARVVQQSAEGLEGVPDAERVPSPAADASTRTMAGPSRGSAAPVAVAAASGRKPAQEEQLDPGLVGQLAVAVSACRRSRCALSLLLVELGSVDEVVMTRGVDGLESVRRLLEELCRGVDHTCAICLPYREAGFAVILPDCDRQVAARLGHQLLAAIAGVARGQAFVEVQGLRVDVGAATVSLPPKNFQPEDLLKAAGRCLYGSHVSGGGVVKSIEIY